MTTKHQWRIKYGEGVGFFYLEKGDQVCGWYGEPRAIGGEVALFSTKDCARIFATKYGKEIVDDG